MNMPFMHAGQPAGFTGNSNDAKTPRTYAGSRRSAQGSFPQAAGLKRPITSEVVDLTSRPAAKVHRTNVGWPWEKVFGRSEPEHIDLT